MIRISTIGCWLGHGIEEIQVDAGASVDEAAASLDPLSEGKVSAPTRRSSPLAVVTLKTISTDPLRAERGNDVV